MFIKILNLNQIPRIGILEISINLIDYILLIITHIVGLVKFTMATVAATKNCQSRYSLSKSVIKMKYSLEERLQIVTLYYKCQENARETRRRYFATFHRNISTNTILRIKNLFEETKSLHDKKKVFEE